MHLKVELGAIMIERDWILTAIQDLQELANRHSMEEVANALNDVLQIAIVEVEADEEPKLIASSEQKPRTTCEVVILPCGRSAQNNWCLSS